MYNTSTFEVVRSNINQLQPNKTFVIDHPISKDKYLQHACLEGPEAGVYYRGKCVITNNSYVEIQLPEYVDKIANNFTVHVNPVADFDDSFVSEKQYIATTVKNNKFRVFGKNGKFDWIVYGERCKIDVEPLKSEYSLKGDGPYTYLVKNNY
jgi:hypothetical protein